jgi:hypothetical protein
LSSTSVGVLVTSEGVRNIKDAGTSIESTTAGMPTTAGKPTTEGTKATVGDAGHIS